MEITRPDIANLLRLLLQYSTIDKTAIAEEKSTIIIKDTMYAEIKLT